MMLRQIWKFEQEGSQIVTGPMVIKMPKGSEILSAAIERSSGLLVLWAMVDPTAESVEHKIFVAWTGWDVDTSVLGRFIDTVQAIGLVWHIFDVGE